jgi:hypothetical protein
VLTRALRSGAPVQTLVDIIEINSNRAFERSCKHETFDEGKVSLVAAHGKSSTHRDELLSLSIVQFRFL